jgi:hypothetical protein
MALPIRISSLKKIKYSLAFFAGVALLWLPAKTAYHAIFHPIENVTMAQLEQKAIRGDEFYYLRITDPAYDMLHADRYMHWYIVPLRMEGNVPIPLIYVNQDSRMSDPLSNLDSSPHPEGLPREILVANMSLTPVPGKIRDNLEKHIDDQIEGRYLAFEEYEEPIIWLDILVALGGLALMYASVRVVFSKDSDETV